MCSAFKLYCTAAAAAEAEAVAALAAAAADAWQLFNMRMPKKKSVKISVQRRAIKMQTLSAISFTLQARTRCVYATRSCIVVASAMVERVCRLGKVSGIQR